MFLDSRREDKSVCTELKQALLKFSLLISSWIEFRYVTIVPKYFNSAHFQMLFLLFIPSEFCRRDNNIYLVFSEFNARPTSLLASITISVLLFAAFTLFVYKFASSA
jgi:hypothetical protein